MAATTDINAELAGYTKVLAVAAACVLAAAVLSTLSSVFPNVTHISIAWPIQVLLYALSFALSLVAIFSGSASIILPSR